jgi:hypothetical protein
MLDGKLQLKNGQTIAVINEPYEVEVAAARASTDAADAVLVFVKIEPHSRSASQFSVMRAPVVQWPGWRTRKPSNSRQI